MERSKFIKDYLASRLISQDKMVDGYGKIYLKANEDLVDTYFDVDFYEKDVLSVLSSGDQVLTSRFLDAKNVESFDTNPLTIYYFYLRLWTLKYQKALYPKVFNGNEWLASLLKIVKSQNEKEAQALTFFRNHVNDNTDIENLFYYVDVQPKGNTLYTKAEELEDCLSPELAFYNVDIFNKLKNSKRYDIILMSNILDWARNNPVKLEMAKSNLTKLLKEDGTIICCSLIRSDERSFEVEREIFENDFEYNGSMQGYTYTRKRH